MARQLLGGHMVKIAVCDNDVGEVNRLRNLLTLNEEFSVRAYAESLELSKEISAGEKFDIYLLDIVMPKMSGLELAEKIRRTDENAFIIFLTNHDQYALSAFGVGAFQYLLKPIDPARLHAEIKLARNFILRRSQTMLPLKTREGLVALPFHNIAYCFVEDRCVICSDINGQLTKGSTLRIPFGTAIMALLKDRAFVQTHISFVANLDYVFCLEEKNFLMRDDSIVPIAQSVYAKVRERYLAHVFGGEPNAI
jgi:DNA-binding LytR/AlgR family response regulator